MKKVLIFCFLFCFVILYCFLPFNNKQNNNEKTIIKFSSWGSKTEYKILKEIIDDYEKQNQNVKIEFIHVPENYFRKLHLLYAAKTAPDVVFLNNTYAPLYIQSNLLEDLSGIINENDYFKSSTECFKYDNKLFAIPRDISNLVVFVNKNIVKNPEKIKTLKDLRYYAKKNTNNEHFGLNYEKNPLFWLYYLSYFNGGILSDDAKTVILNTDKSKRGFITYYEMINTDKSIPKEWQTSSMTSAQMFISGKIAMYLSGHWVIPKFRETLNFDWDIIPFPTEKQTKTLTDASGWAVSKESKHKKEAIDFVKYLASAEVSEKFMKTGLITPARKDIAKMEITYSTNKKPKNLHVFTDILKNSKPTPVNQNYAKIVDEVVKTTTPIFNGEKNIEEIQNQKFIDKLQKYCDNGF